MDGLVLGVDLCDTYTSITALEPERTWTIKTAVCKNRQSEEWYVGEEASARAMAGDLHWDSLLSRIQRDEKEPERENGYTGLDLLKRFLKEALELPKKEAGKEEVSQLAIALRKPEIRLMDSLLYCADYLGIDRSRVHIVSHTESFVYYVMSQKRDVWSNQVGMFELSEGCAGYYELKTQRGSRGMIVTADREELQEEITMEYLKRPEGAASEDQFLAACADRILDKRLFSAVILTGDGFATTDWAHSFMKKICSKRRVFAEYGLFSKGAAYRGADYERERTDYPFICICEGRLQYTISLRVLNRGKDTSLVLAAAGDNWYEARSTVDLIADGEDHLEFVISSLDQRKKRVVPVALQDFPIRENKTNRIQVTIGFSDESTMIIMVKDKGFGELFPATKAMVRQEVVL